MIPALDWLGANAHELLGQNPTPGVFYWSAGTLSSTLDNASDLSPVVLSALFGTSGAGAIGELLSRHSLDLLPSVWARWFFRRGDLHRKRDRIS